MTYNIGHMIIAMLLGVVIGVLIVGAVIIDANASPISGRHECRAPCTVVLPPNTLEDEFGINYGWRNRRTPIVDVYVRKGN